MRTLDPIHHLLWLCAVDRESYVFRHLWTWSTEVVGVSATTIQNCRILPALCFHDFMVFIWFTSTYVSQKCKLSSGDKHFGWSFGVTTPSRGQRFGLHHSPFTSWTWANWILPSTVMKWLQHANIWKMDSQNLSEHRGLNLHSGLDAIYIVQRFSFQIILSQTRWSLLHP